MCTLMGQSLRHSVSSYWCQYPRKTRSRRHARYELLDCHVFSTIHLCKSLGLLQTGTVWPLAAGNALRMV